MQDLELLGKRYEPIVGETANNITDILKELRVHAVEKLKARDKFKEDNIATFKVKLAGKIPENVS